jgi:hypothetical protein
MTTFTEIVAAVVVQSSAAAYSHFGVMLEPPRIERSAAVHVVARTPAARPAEKLPNCPDTVRTRSLKA